MEGTEALVKPVGLDSGIHAFESFLSHLGAQRILDSDLAFCFSESWFPLSVKWIIITSRCCGEN